MFSKIKKYFREVKIMVFRSVELSRYTRKDVAIIRESVEDFTQRHYEFCMQITKAQAAIAKTLSSLEMEMLLARGACLANNFEGKENL